MNRVSRQFTRRCIYPTFRRFCQQGPSTEDVIRYRIMKFRRIVYPMLVGGLISLGGATYYLQRNEELRHFITEYPGIFLPFVELFDVMKISPTEKEATDSKDSEQSHPNPISLLPSLDEPSNLQSNPGRDLLMDFFKRASIPLTCVQVALLAILASNNVGATMFPVLKRYRSQILMVGSAVIVGGGYLVIEAAMEMKQKGDALKLEAQNNDNYTGNDREKPSR